MATLTETDTVCRIYSTRHGEVYSGPDDVESRQHFLMFRDEAMDHTELALILTVQEPGEEWPSVVEWFCESDNNTHDPIRVWYEPHYGFCLAMWDNGKRRYGKDVLSYKFWHKSELIFEGDDYGCSPMHSIDGNESVAGLLSFLSLKPGDTDSEYFESYTPRQLAWCKANGENLSTYVEELEGR